MKKILIMIFLSLSNIATAQDNPPFIAYTQIIEKWNRNTRTFQRTDIVNCNWKVFMLKDRIKVKDDNNSVYYMSGKNNGSTEEKQFLIGVFNCYDQKGDDCLVSLIANKETMEVVLVVTYADKIQYTYSLKEF